MIIVDAANVIGSRPDGWWRDRPGAAARLVDRLRAAVAAGRLADVIVVVEGASRRGAPAGDVDGVVVVHAAASGDDAVVSSVAAATDTSTVVTADRGLRRRVEELGATTVGPDWLYERLSP